MRLRTDSSQDREIACLVSFYMEHREASIIEVTDMLWTSATGEMSMAEARAHIGPFRGMKHVSCKKPGTKHPDEHVLIASNGEVLHLH